MKIEAKIKKMPNEKFRVTDESGKKNLGEYDSRSGAENRLRQVEYFKHKKSGVATMKKSFNLKKIRKAYHGDPEERNKNPFLSSPNIGGIPDDEMHLFQTDDLNERISGFLNSAKGISKKMQSLSEMADRISEEQANELYHSEELSELQVELEMLLDNLKQLIIEGR